MRYQNVRLSLGLGSEQQEDHGFSIYEERGLW